MIFGRTLEWGSFDLNSRLVVVPRGYEYKSRLESGRIGKTWRTVYGAVGVDAKLSPVNRDLRLRNDLLSNFPLQRPEARGARSGR